MVGRPERVSGAYPWSLARGHSKGVTSPLGIVRFSRHPILSVRKDSHAQRAQREGVWYRPPGDD